MTSFYVTLTMLAYNVSDRLKKEEKGATAVEYGLLVGLIAVAIIVAVTALGTKLSGLFTSVTGGL
jgi:pilus assembly protein Flp/PilA